jgi:hypothetical protein
MTNYNTYPSKGIDSNIKQIQNVLFSKLGFTNVDFYGCVLKSLNKDSKTIIPEFYYDFPKKREVYYDGKNAPGGNIFFIDGDKHKELRGGLFQADIKIIFMLNLEKLFPNKEYRASSEVQEHCIKLVKKLGCFSGSITLEKGLENVLSGFDTSKIKLNDMQPYHIFSINGTINYSFNCNH